jgi:hypothetical protein
MLLGPAQGRITHNCLGVGFGKGGREMNPGGEMATHPDPPPQEDRRAAGGLGRAPYNRPRSDEFLVVPT